MNLLLQDWLKRVRCFINLQANRVFSNHNFDVKTMNRSAPLQYFGLKCVAYLTQKRCLPIGCKGSSGICGAFKDKEIILV